MLIKSLLNKKALRPNGIFNKVFKAVALVIIRNLVEVASYYFTNIILLKHLKESTIVVLYKEGKKDYSFLGSYRLITFKNILVKALKKYVANIISKAMEKYILLL